MRLLEPGEQVIVESEDLIAGQPNCGTATVASVVDKYESHSGTTYGLTLEPAELVSAMGRITLKPEMYFAFAGEGVLRSKSAVAITRHGYKGFNTIGGPVENSGRLRYIDGCTDSLLIGPPVVGDPCFNLLHFPRNIRQTMHTHPSLRCGITVSGKGRAIFPDGEVPLKPGKCWFLQTGGEHCFHTDDSEMLVTAWHPDTDTGPGHRDHPMLNRTIIEGVSARHLNCIQTVEPMPTHYPPPIGKKAERA